MAKITYENKVALNVNSDIADINKVNASDLNEIKNVVNTNDDNTNNNSNAIGNLSDLTTPVVSSLVGAINSIVESGSNENGNWIKYADGTMICWKTYSFTANFNTEWGSVYECPEQNFGATAQTFISVPTIFGNNGNGATATLEGISETTVNSFGKCVLFRPVSGGANVKINLLAIGKWK